MEELPRILIEQLRGLSPPYEETLTEEEIESLVEVNDFLELTEEQCLASNGVARFRHVFLRDIPVTHVMDDLSDDYWCFGYWLSVDEVVELGRQTLSSTEEMAEKFRQILAAAGIQRGEQS